MIKTFGDLRKLAIGKKDEKFALVFPHSEHVIKAGVLAKKENISEPLFIGDKDKISEILKKLSEEPSDYEIINVVDEEKSAEIAVELAREGKVSSILKGNISTSKLLKKVLDKEKGLRTGRLLSDVLISEDTSKGEKRLIGMSDGGINILPSLDELKIIVENAVAVFKKLGFEKPKVAVLSCIEYVNEKIPSTVLAKKLEEMNKKGEIKGCVVQGPLALDLAVSEFAGKVKGVEGEVVGNADILIVPSIEAGNILGKAFTYFVKAMVAHIIVGAMVPVLIPSRAEKEEERLNSIALATIVGRVFD